MAAYQREQSFFARLSLLRLRLHSAFRMLAAEQPSADSSSEQEQAALHRRSPASSALLSALSSLDPLFASFSPFHPPFPAALFQHLILLTSFVDPSRAARLLKSYERHSHLPPHYPSHVAVIRGFASAGDFDRVGRLIRGLMGSDAAGERRTVAPAAAGGRAVVQLNAELALLWLQSAESDEAAMRCVESELRASGVQMSVPCFDAMAAARLRGRAPRSSLPSLLDWMRSAAVAVSPSVAFALASACSPSPSSFPSQYIPALRDTGVVVDDSFLLSLMAHHQQHPRAGSAEHVHLLSLHTGDPLSPAAVSLVVRAYAAREHQRTGKIGLRDANVIQRVLQQQKTARVGQADADQREREEAGLSMVRLMLAAQQGDGELVLDMCRRLLEPVPRDRGSASAIPSVSGSLFLPVLRSVAALHHPSRLRLLSAVHEVLEHAGLASSFSFALLLRLQGELCDVQGQRRSLQRMKASGQRLTIHHWHELLAGATSLHAARTLRSMMQASHVLPSPLCEALLLARLADSGDVLGCEEYYAALIATSSPSPPVEVRLVMAGMYMQLGHVQLAARQWWKLASGSREKAPKGEEGAPGNWRVSDDVRGEGVRRMLQLMQQQRFGSREEVQRLLEQLQRERSQRAMAEAAEVERWRAQLRAEWPADVELDEDARALEEERQARAATEASATSLLELRRRELSVDERGVWRRTEDDAVSPQLQAAFRQLMQRMQSRRPYLHTHEVLHGKSSRRGQPGGAVQEEAKQAHSGGSHAPQGRLEEVDEWPEEAESEDGDGYVLMDLDAPQHTQQPQPRSHSAHHITAAPAGSQQQAEEELLAGDELLQAARRLVHQRSSEPSRTGGGRGLEGRDGPFAGHPDTASTPRQPPSSA